MTITTVAVGEKDIFKIVQTVRQLCEGHNNATGTVTLRASQTTTVVAAPNCAPGSAVFLFPQTANAAAVVASTYVLAANVIKEQFTITHPSNGNTDKTFWYVTLG